MADVELLPLPEGYDKYDPPLLYEGQMFHEGQMRAYARANVARATSTLQAEIGALRAEVSGLRAARIAYANEFPATEDGDPDTGNIHANIRALKARAERLAEALDELSNDAAKYRWALNNSRWIRGEHAAYVAIPVAREADLSCVAMRDAAIDEAMEKENKA